jgi:hypothetical protein
MRHSWSSGVAACIGVDPNIFFIDTKDLRLVRAAKSYCDHCPCRKPCLEYGYTTGQVGIWGGTTDAERPFAYTLLQAASNVPVVVSNVVVKRQVGTYDFSLSKKPDAKLRRLDEQAHPSVPSHRIFPYSHSQQAYRLAVAARILRRERERVIEASQCTA